jgi:hypothetical protein
MFAIRKIYLVIVIYFLVLIPMPVFATGTMSQGMAIDLDVGSNNIAEGSIISLINGKYRLSNTPYDNNVFGVVTDHPSVVFKDYATENKRSVVSIGKSILRVSSLNGNIKTGDYITTSTIPGVGQKATENGYVIGVAQQVYNSKDPNKIGTIYVILHLNFGLISMGLRENLLVAFRQGMRAPFSSPLNVMRYLMSAITALLSFGAGFWFFGRVSSHGVEAIGRNPLARKFILLSVLFNVAITVSVMLLGVALAYLILVI